MSFGPDPGRGLPLIGAAPAGPEGFAYRPELVSREEAAILVARFEGLSFRPGHAEVEGVAPELPGFPSPSAGMSWGR